jgi:hypothetical protein
MSSTLPLACNMDVFTPAQRDSHARITTELMQSIQELREVKNGYQFLFPNEAELISKIAEFILNERLCCPFLEFTLQVNVNNEPISLALVGPEGTQEFMRLEFSGAFQ